MPSYFAALTFVLLIGMVITRALRMKKEGITAMNFGKTDKKDFLILPFVLFYFYTVFATPFNLPPISKQEFFHSEVIAWAGVFLCLAGILLFLLSLVSFGKSFRVGIDKEDADKLVTTGVFAYSRNPIYLAFGVVLIGQFLIFSNWIVFVYLGAAIWLFHRQVLLEEIYLEEHYGEEFSAYCRLVKRYF